MTEEINRDAWGYTCKEQVNCYTCNGSGTEYNETCCGCGGLGWVCEHDECLDEKECLK